MNTTLVGFNMGVPTNLLQSLNPKYWKPGLVRGPASAAVRWVPLVHLTDQRYYEGLTEDGVWVVETADGLLQLERQHSYAPLLPVLKRNPKEVMSELQEALVTVGLDGQIATHFPFVEVILQGLANGDYWVTLALNWVESWSVDTADREKIMHALMQLVEDKNRASQQARHRIRRLIRELNGDAQ